MEVENTHIQNETPEFAAHAGRERPSWCRWRRLRRNSSCFESLLGGKRWRLEWVLETGPVIAAV
jgi:hypothetical protein